MNYNDLKQIADSKKIEIQEIAYELKMTPNGFRESIKNETIQLKKIRQLCELLNIHPNLFFDLEKGVYLNNVNAQLGNGNKIIVESKDLEIKLLKQSLKDKEELIEMLREKIESIHNAPMLAASEKGIYQTKKK